MTNTFCDVDMHVLPSSLHAGQDHLTIDTQQSIVSDDTLIQKTKVEDHQSHLPHEVITCLLTRLILM